MATKSKLSEAKNSPEEVGQVISLMERVKGFIDKHGFRGTFTTLLTLFIASVVGYAVFNPGAIFEQYQNIIAMKHEEAIKARLDADPQIRAYLLNLKTELNADRACVLETHNGGSNLANLPFLYIDLTYAEPRADFAWLEAEYKNVRLSRYPWASFIYGENYWYGKVEDIEEIDPELYYRLDKEGVKYMGMMTMYNSDFLPSGIITIIYSNEEDAPDRATVMKSLQKYTTIISPLLSHDTYY